MDRTAAKWTLVFGVWCVGILPVRGSEPGDINGDGRVSFGDAYLLRQWLRTGLESFRPAEGSTEFAQSLLCTGELDLPYFIYWESLRRASAQPLPHFFEKWPSPVIPEDDPPSPTAEVEMEILPVVHSSGSGEMELRVRLTSLHPIDAIGIIVKAEGVDLRPRDPAEYGEGDWRGVTSTEYYLLTGGLVAFHSSLWQESSTSPLGFDPSEKLLTLPVVLPRGTEPGAYAIEILPGTEVVTAFGDVLLPQVVSGTLEITRQIETGIDLVFPQIEFHEEERRIHGSASFRVSNAVGTAGNEVTVKVQAWTERPINHLKLRLWFDQRVLLLEEVSPLYVDPEFGVVLTDDFFSTPLLGDVSVYYSQNVRTSSYTPYFPSPHRKPSLKYLAPMGQWIDFVALRFRVRSDATSGATPVAFLHRDSGSFNELVPYLQQEGNLSCDDEASWWTYDPTMYVDGTIFVDGDDNPPEDLDPPVDVETANIRYTIGESGEDGKPLEVLARPGERVELPVVLETAVDLWKVRMAFGFDNTQLELEGMRVNFVDFDGAPYDQLLLREEGENGNLQMNLFCTRKPGEDIPTCVAGLFPRYAWLHIKPFEDVPENVWLVDIVTAYRTNQPNLALAWPSDAPYLLGEALFRVREDARDGTTEIAGTSVDWHPNSSPLVTTSVSSGYMIFPQDEEREDIPIPAITVRRGVVRITSEPPDFVRGDTSGNGRLELTDAVQVLVSLFRGGGPLNCADAADANDDGRLELTDAIYSLRWQFVANSPPPPPPFPEPGRDPTDDDLDCRTSIEL